MAGRKQAHENSPRSPDVTSNPRQPAAADQAHAAGAASSRSPTAPGGPGVEGGELGQVQARLREAHDRYSMLFHRAPVGYVTLVPECRIQEVNDEAARMLGVPPAELVGREITRFVLPEDLEDLKVHLAGVCRGRAEVPLEARFVGADGRTFCARLECVAIHDADGAPRECHIAMIDVTDAKQAAARLRRSQSLLRTIINATREAMIAVGPDGGITLFNKAAEEMFGRSAEEMIGRPVDLLMPERYRPQHRNYLRGFFAEGKPDGAIGRVLELPALRADGTEFPIEISLSAGENEQGRFVIAVVRDVSERRRLEQHRKQIESHVQHMQKLESLGLLAGGVAHDFSNLLVGVLGNVSLAMDQLSPGSPIWEPLERIEKAARRAADLTRQLLAYSGCGRFVVEPLDLSRVIADMRQLLLASVSKKARLRLELGRDLPLVAADATQVRQVTMNLVTNASEALSDGAGEIRLRVAARHVDKEFLASAYLGGDLAPGRHVVIEVSDDGCGMDAETLARIFDPFFTTKFTGRGLGLAAAVGIMRAHHGAIHVTSRVGCGTTVTLVFPSTREKPAVRRSLAPPAGAHKAGTILLADDEEVVRTVARASLERLGYEVLVAADGHAAVETYREHASEIDLVLLDLTMPGLDGREVLRELRRLDPDVRAILSSGYDVSQRREELGLGDRVHFIQKPYSFATLGNVVRSALRA